MHKRRNNKQHILCRHPDLNRATHQQAISISIFIHNLPMILRATIKSASRLAKLRKLNPNNSSNYNIHNKMKFSHFATCFAATAASTAHAFVPATSFRSSSNANSNKLFSSTATSTEDSSTYADADRYMNDHPNNNIPPHIAALVGRGLHTKENHPIGIVRAKIQDYFSTLDQEYKIFDAEDPIVTCTQCFDDLRINPDHPGRSPSDTYYIDDKTLLRTHTSAHQSMHLRDGYERFLCAGDVYRRDEIDASHYPAFHQLEAVKLFDPSEVKGADGLSKEEWLASPECKMISDDLKNVLEGLMDHLFGPVEKKWSEDFFPFAEPSFECEILFVQRRMARGTRVRCRPHRSTVLEMVGREDRRGCDGPLDWASSVLQWSCLEFPTFDCSGPKTRPTIPQKNQVRKNHQLQLLLEIPTGLQGHCLLVDRRLCCRERLFRTSSWY